MTDMFIFIIVLDRLFVVVGPLLVIRFVKNYMTNFGRIWLSI